MAVVAAPRNKMLELNSDTFDEAIYDEALPSVVLFTRPGCSVCKTVEPQVDSVAAEEAAAGSPWHFYEVDAEASLDLVGRFSLAGVPQVLLFVDGELRDRRAGRVTSGELRGMLEGVQGWEL